MHAYAPCTTTVEVSWKSAERMHLPHKGCNNISQERVEFACIDRIDFIGNLAKNIIWFLAFLFSQSSSQLMNIPLSPAMD